MKIVWGRSIGFNIELNKMVKLTRPVPEPMSYNGAGQFNPSPGKKYMDYRIITDGAGCYPWKKYFAFFPSKTIAGQRVWWESAYKRKVWIVWGIGFHMEPEVQYATLFEILKEEQ